MFLGHNPEAQLLVRAGKWVVVLDTAPVPVVPTILPKNPSGPTFFAPKSTCSHYFAQKSNGSARSIRCICGLWLSTWSWVVVQPREGRPMEESWKSCGNGEYLNMLLNLESESVEVTRYQAKVDTGGVACDCGPVEARMRWKWDFQKECFYECCDF